MSRRVLIGWLAGAAGVAGLITFGLHQLLDSSDVCEDVTKQEALSPDAHLKAVVYSRSCGVFTTGLYTQVTIVGADERLPKEPGNVYIVRGEDSQPIARVHWNDSRSLSVEEDSGASGRDVSEAEKRVRVHLGWFRSADVAIRYAHITGRPVTASNK